MKFCLQVVFIAFIMITCNNTALHAACTADDVQMLDDKGVQPSEVAKICGNVGYSDPANGEQDTDPNNPDADTRRAVSPFSQRLPANGLQGQSVCILSSGRCPMAASAPIGSSCYCMSPSGPIPGIIQLGAPTGYQLSTAPEQQWITASANIPACGESGCYKNFVVCRDAPEGTRPTGATRNETDSFGYAWGSWVGSPTVSDRRVCRVFTQHSHDRSRAVSFQFQVIPSLP